MFGVLWKIVYFSWLVGLRSTASAVITVHDDESIYDRYDGLEFQYLISGGYRPAKHTLAKYVVSIRTSRHTEHFGDNHFCAGIIISSTLVVTAAHCIMDPNKIVTRTRRLLVVAGAPNRLREDEATVVMPVVDVVPHPDFIRGFNNDLALLRLLKPIPDANDAIKIIPLASSPATPGMNCTAVGWGQLFYRGPYSAEAIYVDLHIFPPSYCHEAYPGFFGDGLLCAGNEDDWGMDTCRGDSGGPLICDNKLHGITSWSKMCAVPGYPTVFTDVFTHREWIDNMNGSIMLHASLANTIVMAMLLIKL